VAWVANRLMIDPQAANIREARSLRLGAAKPCAVPNSCMHPRAQGSLQSYRLRPGLER
jgi:hypothetical protein